MGLYHVLNFKADKKKQITRMLENIRQKVLKHTVVILVREETQKYNRQKVSDNLQGYHT